MARPDLDVTFATRVARLVGRRPIRAGSLIVTLYGDAILPRGGVLGLAALTALVEPFGLNSGQIRTALSRLVADGWFVRTRDGRASFYALAPARVAEFRTAAERIYAPVGPRRSLGFEQLVLTAADPADRARLRERLAREGYGALAPNVLLRAADGLSDRGDPAPSGTVRASIGEIGGDPADLRAMAAAAWLLRRLAGDYRALIADFRPLAAATVDATAAADRAAFAARVLLVHEFRRLVLRDPHLPDALLPVDWPGGVARELCARLYLAVLPASEAWLGGIAADLAPAGPEIHTRFVQV